METPFFVIGFPRSGTTMLQCMLNAHPRLACPAETRFMIPAYERRKHSGDMRVLANREKLADGMLNNKYRHLQDLGVDKAVLREAMVNSAGTLGSFCAAPYEAFAKQNGKERWGDKHPRYTRHVDMLLDLFPGAQIVHLIRDPRDGVESLMRMPWYNRDRYHATWHWAMVDDIGRGLRESLPTNQYFELKYEEVVMDPEGALRPLAEFLGEEFHEYMCHPEIGAGSGLPPDRYFHKAIRTGVRPEMKQKWRDALDKSTTGLIEWALGDRMVKQGYELSGAPEPTKEERKAYQKVDRQRTIGEMRAKAIKRYRAMTYQYPAARVVTDDAQQQATAQA